MSKFINPQYKDLESYTPGEQPRDMVYVKLNTNESPFPPSPRVIERINKEEVSNLRLYSDPECKLLREAIAKSYGYNAENIFVGNGSDEILSMFFMAFGAKGIAFPDISYGFYKVYGGLYGINYTQIPLKSDFTINVDDYCNIDKNIVIANPNAPTGISITVRDIEKILITNPTNIVLIDEAYVDFGGMSCTDLVHKYDNLLVVQTYSKSRSLAGARLGYGIANKSIIDDLTKIKFSINPYNINRLTLVAGICAMEDKEYFEKNCAEIIKIKAYTVENLKKRGFNVLPSDANFVFAKHEYVGGKKLYLKLKENGVLIRQFDKERISDYLRISIGTKVQMNALFVALDKILMEEKL